MIGKIKPCKYCGATNHYPYQCRLNPKKRKPIKKVGKQFFKWLEVRESWIKRHPGPWFCYICKDKLTEKTLTLDHVIPKSNAKNYANRHDDSNLKPCCWDCNSEKGSKHKV